MSSDTFGIIGMVAEAVHDKVQGWIRRLTPHGTRASVQRATADISKDDTPTWPSGSAPEQSSPASSPVLQPVHAHVTSRAQKTKKNKRRKVTDSTVPVEDNNDAVPATHFPMQMIVDSDYVGRNTSVIKRKASTISQQSKDDADPTPNLALSPLMGSASHPMMSTPQTRRNVDATLTQELQGKELEAHDLVDHLVGSFISIETGAAMLHALLSSGYITIDKEIPITTVIEHATRFACLRACKRDHGLKMPDAEALSKLRQKSRPTLQCTRQPSKPVQDHELVNFLNETLFFCLATLREAEALGTVPASGRTHAFQFTVISSEYRCAESNADDHMDMRPDFALVPASSWRPQCSMPPPASLPRPAPKQTSLLLGYKVLRSRKVKLNLNKDVASSSRSSRQKAAPRGKADTSAAKLSALTTPVANVPTAWASPDFRNFTMFRVMGECKTGAHAQGVRQLKRYMRGMCRAQPWLRFRLGLSYSNGRLHVARSDQSGVEETNLDLTDPAHILDFLRLLVGLALMTDEELGADSAFELGEKDGLMHAKSTRSRSRSQSPSVASSRPVSRASSRGLPPSTVMSESTCTSPMKRKASMSTYDGDEDEPTSGIYRVRYIKSMTIPVSEASCPNEHIPIKGIMYVSGSLRGRGTVVLAGQESSGRLIAIKRAWGDRARTPEHEFHLEIVNATERLPHTERMGASFVLLAHRFWTAMQDGREDSTLRCIRGFKDDEHLNWGIEDRVQYGLMTDLKRPMALFYSLQDAVGGIIDAIKGHQFLVEKVGLLHRDISEANIVLGLQAPGEPRGYLMDLDMATRISPVDQTKRVPASESLLLSQSHHAVIDAPDQVTSSSASGSQSIEVDVPPRAARTGTPPYMAIDVLYGHSHTVSHDLESFFYVLYLMLHHYNGPLPRLDGSTWPRPDMYVSERNQRLSHVREWPHSLLKWTGGPKITFDDIANSKAGRMANYPHMWSSLVKELPQYWNRREDVLDLVKTAYDVFWSPSPDKTVKLYQLRDNVVHSELIGALEGWMTRYPGA